MHFWSQRVIYNGFANETGFFPCSWQICNMFFAHSVTSTLLRYNSSYLFIPKMLNQMEDNDVIPVSNKSYSTKDYWEERYKK
jgi:hypothetical protein